MEFNVSSAELLKALMDVSKAIPAKTVLPILDNFLFEAKNNILTVTASDQELTLRTELPVDCIEDGSIAVPSHQLIDLVKSLPDQPVCIKTTSDNSFECTWNNGNSSLPYYPAEDYPEITDNCDNTRNIVFPAQALVTGISSTVYATADDEMRPAMNGIFFDIDIDRTTLVASDSHKLICYTDEQLKSPIKTSFILHKKPALILKNTIGKDTTEVEVNFDESSAVFKFDTTILICRLIIGRYPRYRDVIPQNNSNILKIDRVQLLNTVKRVSVCSNKASNHIKFELGEGQLEITAQDLSFAIAAYEKVPCEYDGDIISIGFKSSFLIEILYNMSCENIIMKFADARRAVLIVPSEEEAEKEKICGIIMPIMVS